MLFFQVMTDNVQCFFTFLRISTYISLGLYSFCDAEANIG